MTWSDGVLASVADEDVSHSAPSSWRQAAMEPFRHCYRQMPADEVGEARRAAPRAVHSPSSCVERDGRHAGLLRGQPSPRKDPRTCAGVVLAQALWLYLGPGTGGAVACDDPACS